MMDYLSLAKPRAVILNVLTAACGMVLASGGMPPPYLLLFVLVGGGFEAGAANALNCYFDRDIDALMPRTRDRPLPAGRLAPSRAVAFAGVTGVLGLIVLFRFAGSAAAILAAAALAYYVLVYTVWLKRRTGWSVIIGSLAGGVPPVVAWVAVRPGIELAPLLLFSIITLWTPPHFWALAVMRRVEYRRAGFGMTPPRHATRWAVFCSISLLALTVLLAPAAGLGLTYLVTATVAGLGLILLSGLLRQSDPSPSARRLYFYSILYLAMLFAAMALDRLV